VEYRAENRTTEMEDIIKNGRKIASLEKQEA